MIISIDSITGNDLPDAVRKKIQDRVAANNASRFPDKPIAIGESFEQKVPIKMVLAGAEVEITVTTTFRLREIKNNMGIFDVSTTSTGDANIQFGKFNSSITGTGTAEYDVEKKIMPKVEILAVMEITMGTGEFAIHIKNVSKSLQTLSIE